MQKIGAFRSKTQRPKSKNRTCYSIDLRISSENEQQVDIPQRKTPEERREEKTAITTTATTIEMVFIWLNTIKWALKKKTQPMQCKRYSINNNDRKEDSQSDKKGLKTHTMQKMK